MFTKTTQLLPIQSPDKTSQEGNCIPLCHTMLFSEIFCVQQIYLALLNVASGISPLSRRHHRDGRILTQSFKKKLLKKTANSKTKYCPPATQLWHGVMTLWQYPFRGRQVFVGSGALVPARKKKLSCVGGLKNGDNATNMPLNISYASSMWCGSILILKTSRLRRFDGFLLPTNLFGWWSPSPQFGARLLLNFGATVKSRAWTPPSSQRHCFRTLSTRCPSTQSSHHHWHFFSTPKQRA